MRLNRVPPVIVQDTALVRFHDPHTPARYARGVLWVGLRPDDPTRVVWTEGVRLCADSDAVDVENMHPHIRDLYERTPRGDAMAWIID